MNITIGLLIIIKCIAANDRTCLYYYIIADHGIIKYGYIRIDHTIFTDADMITNIGAWHDGRSLTNTHRIACHFHRWAERTEVLYDGLIGVEWIIGYKQGLTIGEISFFIDDDETCS